MRVLEQCIPSATPDIRAQINALREAFSIDTRQPFELKPNLGVQSPTLEHAPTPPAVRHSPASKSVSQSASWMPLSEAASSNTLSPASEYMPPFDRLQGESAPSSARVAYGSATYPMPGHSGFAPSTLHQVNPPAHTGYALAPVISNEQQTTPIWDPSGIFEHWSSAFGGQPQPSPPQAQAHGTTITTSSPPIVPQQPSPTSHPSMYQPQQPVQNTGATVPETTLPVLPTVTPVMWQDAFTTAYVSGHGNKRYRPDDQGWHDPYAKRRG